MTICNNLDQSWVKGFLYYRENNTKNYEWNVFLHENRFIIIKLIYFIILIAYYFMNLNKF